MAGGGQHSCGLRPDGTAVCWGLDYNGQATPPEGRLEAVAAGGNHSCGLRAGGAVEFWGFNYVERAEPPEGSFSAVAAGIAHTCYGTLSVDDIAALPVADLTDDRAHCYLWVPNALLPYGLMSSSCVGTPPR